MRLLCLILLLVSGCCAAAVVEQDEVFELGDTRLVLDVPLTAVDREYMEAGEEFLLALAGEHYERAFELLSDQARRKMSLNQFHAPDTEEAADRQNQRPLLQVTAEDFRQQMKAVVDQHGSPRSATDLYVQTTDPEILSGRGDAWDTMFCLGMMPDSIPHESRRASLRGTIETELSPNRAFLIAQDYGISVADVLSDEDFVPYFTVKIVLVEEHERLKVGYFEILPPSILD